MTTSGPPPNHDRMAGEYGRPWCPYCGTPPGPDCADAGHSTRHRRRREDRAVRRYTDTAVKDESAAADADNDPSDCRHGCNGDCVSTGCSGDKCNFTCHPHLNACPRCERVMERSEFHDHENRDCGGYWSCTKCAFMEPFMLRCPDE